MRLLAVRGRNLASLGAFEIDLSMPPLAGAGLFAVTGDTGAGKTTILDAITLALYADYPRVNGAGNVRTPDPGGATLTGGDARTILSRGAGLGHAEVDFVGIDGHAYRARWSVARARGRVDGRMQNAARVLSRLPDGLSVAEGLTAVGEEVARLTGLTYPQFVRTVLLPQGAFDAFLTAPESDRAIVLERITDTGIYAELSRRVHHETEARRRRVADLRARLDAVGLLTGEERIALEADLARVRSDLAVATAERDALSAALRHAAQVTSCEGLVQNAEAKVTAAIAALDVRADDRARLAQSEAVESLRVLDADVRRTADDSRSAMEEHAEAEAEHARLVGASSSAEAALAEADAGHVKAEAAVEDHRSAWAEAERVDADCANATRDVLALKVREGKATTALDEATTRVGSARLRLATLEERRRDVVWRMAETTAHDRLADDAGRVSQLCDAHIDALARMTDEAGKLEGLRERAEQCRRSIQRAETESGLLVSERNRLDGVVADLRTRRDAHGLPGLLDRRHAAETLATMLKDAHRDHRRHVRAAASRASASRELSDAKTAVATADGQIRVADESGRMLQAEQRGVVSATRRAEVAASKSAAVLRASLVDGEPCPVCGSMEHRPAASSELDRLVEGLRRDRDALDLKVEDALAARSHAVEARAVAAGRATAAEQALGDANDEAAEASSSFDARLPEAAAAMASCGLDAVVPPIDAADAAASWVALSDRIGEMREGISAKIAEAERLGREADDMVDERDGVARQVDTLAAQSTDAARDRHAVELEIHAAVARRDTAVRQAGTSRTDLFLYVGMAGLGMDAFDADPSGTGDILADLAKARLSLREEVVRVDADMTLASAQVGSAVEVERTAAEAHEEIVEALQVSNGHMAELTARRGAMLGGEPVHAHRTKFETAARQARDELAEARTASALAAGEVRAAGERVGKAMLQKEIMGKAHAVAIQILTRAREAIALPDDRVADLLATAREEVEAVRAAIETLEAEHRTAVCLLETRRQDLQRTIGEAPGTTVPDDAADRLAVLEAGVGERTRNVGVFEDRLRRDDGERGKADGVRKGVHEAEADHASWADVDQAIGSANGATFRQYAQEITLESLVALANEQLGMLAPRYRLARGDALSLHVADMDMGGEVRASRSLSGGERFLVSLGLALALSGLEGRQGSCDVLLIDEGFGSLDSGSLDVAVEALETLQGLGRKVGVVTHVAAMVDRIPTQVRVTKRGGGRSVVEVQATCAMA